MKFYGPIGYGITEETSPGVWTETVKEINYYGDVTRVNSRWSSGENLNDNLTVNNEISIISDPFAIEHFQSIRYIQWLGTKWKVATVTVEYPRLKLTLGGVYNGQ